MEVIRAFIAISLPQKVRVQLGLIINSISVENPMEFIRWIAVDKIHLTLMFLGDVPYSRIELLKENLDLELASRSQFNIRLDGLGAFPSLTRPKVIWIGVKYPSDLPEIRNVIQVRFGNLGFQREDRPFNPHLTIGRVTRILPAGSQKTIGNLIQNTSVKFGSSIKIKRIDLIQSDLKPDGAVYTKLHSVELLTNPDN